MKRLLLIATVLSLFSVALVGCRVEGEIDDAASIPAVR